jgi:hypothetical protein
MCRSVTMLDKLVDRFPLPSVAPPIGDTSLTHVMRHIQLRRQRLLR